MTDNYETKRTIEEVLDLETGLIINSKKFFSQPESIIVEFRRHLQEAILGYKSSKFVCPHCMQKVKLSGMSTQRGVVSFFAHLHDSDDCEIKTSSNLTKEEIEALKYANVRESERHIELKDEISCALTDERSKEIGITDVAIEKRIISKIPYLNWRQPDISAEFNGRKIVFELQLSTTFLSVIVERDIFYKMNNIFIVWIFNFSDNQEYVNMSNLMCKDIYYSNKRNAFVFDAIAMQLSEERKELILQCIWFEPYLENGVFNPKKSIKKSKYIGLNELKFDDINYKPYYIDADKLFAQYQPALYSQREVDETIFVDRLRGSIKNTEKKIELHKNRDNINLSIKEKLRAEELILRPFQKGEKWGYEAEGVVVVDPTYSEAFEFADNQFARVKKNKKYGFINTTGDLHVACDYIEAFDILNGKCIVKNSAGWYCLDIKNKNKEFIDCHGIALLNATEKYLKVQFRITKKVFVGVNRGGYNTYRNSYNDSYGILTYDGKILINDCSYIDCIDNRALIIFHKDELNIYTNDLNKIFPFNFNGFNYQYDNKTLIASRGIKYGYVNIDGDVLIPFDYEFIVNFKNGFANAKKNSKWGVIDKKGNVIIPFEYSNISEFVCGIALAKKEEFSEKWGCIDNKGRVIIPHEYDSNCIELTSEGNVKAKKGNKWGCFNNEGKNIVPFDYDFIGDLNGGKAKAKKNNKWGYIEEYEKETLEEAVEVGNNVLKGKKFEQYGMQTVDGKIIIPFEFDAIEAFIDGKAKAKKDDKWGYIDPNGKPIIVFDFESIEEFIEGKAKAKKDGHWGFIDQNGKPITAFEYDSIEDFIDGKAKAKKDWKWGVINAQGETVIPFEFDSIEEFIDGKLKAKSRMRWGVINTQGETVIPFEFDSIEDFIDGNLKAKSGLKWGVVNAQGKTIIPFEYDSIEGFFDDKVKVKKEMKWGLINALGSMIIPFRYDSIEEFINGKAKAKRNDEWGYIDNDGNELIDYESEIEKGIFVGQRFGKWGIESHDGKNIVPFEYDYIDDFFEGKAIAIKDGRVGVINAQGKTIIPFQFNDIEEFIDGKAKARKGGKDGYIDENGNELTEDEVEIKEGIFKCCKFEKWGIETFDGKNILPYEYDSIGEFVNGIARANKNMKWGVINQEGKAIIPFEYDSIDEFVNGITMVKKGWKSGYIDEKGNVLIADKTEIKEGIFKGHKFGKYGLEDKNGKELMPFKYDFIAPYIDGKALCFLNGKFKIENNSAFKPQLYNAKIDGIASFGVFLKIPSLSKRKNYSSDVIDVKGLLHISEINKAKKQIGEFEKGDFINLYIIYADEKNQRISFSFNPAKERKALSN